MPDITKVFWNIEDFGFPQARRGDYVPLFNFIGPVLQNVDADILCIQELMDHLGGSASQFLQFELTAMTPSTEWYCDWIPRALAGNAQTSYNTSEYVDFTPQARGEGYAVLWKQNIAKFTMQIADPIELATVGAAAGPDAP